jgi:hypothetical protein
MWIRNVPPAWEKYDSENPEHVSRAIDDLLHGGDDSNFSFYRVNNEDELKMAAIIFSTTVRKIPSTQVFIVLPNEGFPEFDPKDDPALHPFLATRHEESKGLTDADKVNDFVKRVLKNCTKIRLTLSEIKKQFVRLCPDDPIWKEKASPEWKKILSKQQPVS